MKYDRIEIHFRTKDNEPRLVIIDSVTNVTAIRLGQPPEKPKIPEALGLHIVGGNVALDDGPGVCYHTPTGLVCW